MIAGGFRSPLLIKLSSWQFPPDESRLLDLFAIGLFGPERSCPPRTRFRPNSFRLKSAATTLFRPILRIEPFPIKSLATFRLSTFSSEILDHALSR